MLRCEAVRKTFFDPGRGPVRAVDGVDLSLGEGVVALVGANGAGKSTLLRLVATLLTPDEGRVLVDGLDTRTQGEAVRARLGYLSTTTRLYPRLSGRELLAFAGGLHGLAGAELERRIAAQCDAFALHAFIDSRMGALSTGQAQRLNLARTLLAEPPLLVLDEPTTGLDVVAARDFTAAVLAARRPGRLILLATHVLREVELAAGQVVVLRAGQVAWQGAVAGLGSGAELEAAVHRLLSAEEHLPPPTSHLPPVSP